MIKKVERRLEGWQGSLLLKGREEEEERGGGWGVGGVLFSSHSA